MAAKPARATRAAAPEKAPEALENVAQAAQATTHPTPGERLTVPEEPRLCLCGCGGGVASKKALFLPGHDAKAASQLVRAVVAGELTEAQALERIAPASERLKDKITRSIKAKQVSTGATENVSA
ncbi:hypothetical protein [Streptosporangium sp. NPDC020145]|uniref:hypothetical protein n=1 Tax=Streptosporangium sp. NPDC020145 TaxID=3154694 RepID=UPI0034222B02